MLNATFSAVQYCSPPVLHDEEVDTEGRVAGNKRPRPAPPAIEMSPLSAPASTVEERNAYLRTIGTDRMKEVSRAESRL